MAGGAVGLAFEKIASKDKDFRYMGTSDMLNELRKDSFQADNETESKLCQVVLTQLDDASGDISALAVSCLTPLTQKLKEAKVVYICSQLYQKLYGKEQQRDIASIALKAMVEAIANPQTAVEVVGMLAPKLTEGIQAEDSCDEVKSECLEILHDLLRRFGNSMAPFQSQLLLALLPQLKSARAGLRKRGINCLAELANHASEDILSRTTASVIDILQQSNVKAEMVRTNIQLVGALCRAVGYRFGPYLDTVLPLLVRFCKNASENDDEAREQSLQALESFVLRCPRDVTPHVGTVLDLALTFLSYDPNFTDDMEEDGDDGDDLEEEEDEESGEEYSDDEDMSWKVRRASAKCLTAIICTRPEMLYTLFAKASPKVVERFREREENVKIDVFNTCIELLRQTGLAMRGSVGGQSSPGQVLQKEVGGIVKALTKQLKEKSAKTRVGALSVLKELVLVLPSCLENYFASLVPGIQKALNDKASNATLKIEALQFTHMVCASHPPPVVQPHVKVLLKPVLAAVGERYYKVTAEALRVCGEFVNTIRPDVLKPSEFSFHPFVHPIYEAIMKRLTAQDQDQEVKECAIFCMGLVVSVLGDQLGPEMKSCLALLLERLRNEITRLTAVKAFATIAESRLKIDLSPVLEQVVGEVTAFLRKANRPLRQASLSTLNSLLHTYSDKVAPSSYAAIIEDLSPLLSDADLAMTGLALELCCTMLLDRDRHATAGPAVRDSVLPKALVLVKSPLLQGQALLTLQRFFDTLVGSAAVSFDSLLQALLSTAPAGPVSKQAYYSTAHCAASLCLAAGPAKCSATVEQLIATLRGGSGDAAHLLALLCLGEIGRRTDLSSHASIQAVLMASFHSPSDEIKAAAAYALGSVAFGNLGAYLPFILSNIGAQAKLQYLLLHSLKEVITRQSREAAVCAEFSPSTIAQILALLFLHCESGEEGVRNVVAECLGRLALIAPFHLLPQLEERTRSPSAHTRATMAMALKFTLVDGAQPLDPLITPRIASFLLLIEDTDRHVRRAAIVALSTAAHNKPGLVTDLLPQLMPLLYNEMTVKAEMIRTVDLGPFKHTVDDGLELRKASFDCVDTLLTNCLDRMNPSTFIAPYLVSGLNDAYDVKMPCHLILTKLAEKCGSAVLAALNEVVEPLERTICSKVKADAVKQEKDRNEDIVRSALRSLDSLSRISNVESNARYRNLVATVKKSSALNAVYQAVKVERESLAGTNLGQIS